MKVDYQKFDGSLPYASEMYGVYQPLLGWRSRRITRRFRGIVSVFRHGFTQAVIDQITPKYIVDPGHRGGPAESGLTIFPGAIISARPAALPAFLQSAVGEEIANRLSVVDVRDQGVWDRLMSQEGLAEILQAAAQSVANNYRASATAYGRTAVAADSGGSNGSRTLTDVLARESQVAGGLHYLYETDQRAVLQTLFTARTQKLDTAAVAGLAQLVGVELGQDAFALPKASLSPIGLVHLFRQYFFEFDSFLGPPVQHVWLTPGATAELVEINTRRTLVERTTESIFETVQKSEKSDTTQDELADAVKDENQNNTKFGVSVDSTSNGTFGVFSTQLTGRTSYEADDARKTAREQTHKQLRQQTTKLSSEIKQSFKSTFRTVVETTDTSSKRYILANTTDKLVNYELRRKMRQVGVQVQDIGTQMCWQAYIDRPGDELGVAKLVHIGQPPDTNVQPAQLVPGPEQYTEDVNGSYTGPDDDDFNDALEDLRLFPKHGFEYAGHSPVQWMSGNVAALSITQDSGDPNVLHLRIQGHSGDNDTFPYRFTVDYKPSDAYLKDIDNENNKRIAAVDQEKERLAKEAFFQEARDRVKAASNIQARAFQDLREEERIVVYRGLIRQLFHGVGLTTVEVSSQHVLAELVQSLFDVDNMLYFVAPEWWVPRSLSGLTHVGAQELGFATQGDKTEFEHEVVSDWGGTGGNRRDNYYITEDSAPAHLGSSLGWLLQLDGDNLRNAFLNAPWVKAVVPIRPGREVEALDWLTNAGVEGSDGLDDFYQEAVPGERAKMLATLKVHLWNDPALQNRYDTLPPADLTIHDALRYLAVVMHDEYELSRVKVSTALPDGTPINYLPTDQVFEHGFDPLKDGFKAAGAPFEVFDQWIEVLPTDQLAAVEVHYDPKTGMQL